ncbi:MAG: D-glycero-beta-D-manno-heptose-7-phosphate kinase [Pseudomonas sp.]|nr:D-glycero-beta-D-manno-heptose-7-phosphate kinase [Pseudomonas sp.]
MADEGMKGSPVLVVGDSMLDCYWQGRVDRISPEAPVPVLCFEREWLHAGGAANVAANLVALGGTATLATLLGEDDAAQQLSTLVEEAGVRLRAVHSADMVTTKKIRAVCSHHQLLRVDIERPASEDDAKTLCELVCGLLPAHRWVVLSDYHKGALSHCPNMIDHARRQDCLVMVDPKGTNFERYRGAWLLKPNEKEAAAVVGAWADEAAFIRAMSQLREHLALEHLLVTRGERGISLFSAHRQPLHMPTAAREVFDVSGAGDTVLAALAGSLSGGQTLQDAVHHANVAAGLAVAKFGTATVTSAEVQEARGKHDARHKTPAMTG